MDSITSKLSKLRLSKDLGQYFTTHETLQEKVFQFILNTPTTILEPSCGQGHLIQYVTQQQRDITFDAYEIDKTITPLEGISNITYGDFLSIDIHKKYKTIIGNPPYVKRRKCKNTYLHFIDKCIGLLEPDGELIFIVPSTFLKLTSASSTITTMLEKGSFTHIYHPSNEHLFERASIDVIVFRYQLDKFNANKVLLNGSETEYVVKNGIVSFNTGNRLISDYFHVYVGLVSGIDRILKNKIGNMKIRTDLDKIEPFIFVDTYPTNDKDLDDYLENNKLDLLSRRIRRFNDTNWFEFGAIRNISVMKVHNGKPCIYVRTMSRKEIIAAKNTVSFFGGSLLMLLPKNDIDLEEVCNCLNHSDFKKHYTYDGRFMISHKQLANASF